MNPELRHPANAAGAALAIIGGVMMLALLFSVPDTIPITGIILWAIGIGLLVIHAAALKRTHHKEKKLID